VRRGCNYEIATPRTWLMCKSLVVGLAPEPPRTGPRLSSLRMTRAARRVNVGVLFEGGLSILATSCVPRGVMFLFLEREISFVPPARPEG